MIRFREYIIVFAVAAFATWAVTFAVRALARRQQLIVIPDDRRVHERPTPTGGGAGMYLGFLAAMAVASQLPSFSAVFRGSSSPFGVVVAATVIFCVGLADDLREMSPPAKLAGQVLAATVLYVFGVNMLFFHVPLAQTTLVLSTNWAVLATVLWVALMANSVNFIDGLDGLAAGIVAIAAAAFFVYSHQLGSLGIIAASNAGPLIAAVTVGVCVGFLPHNFHPAKIFMGDAGSMLLGLLVAASTMAVVGQDSYQFSGRTYFFFAPVLIPFFILGIPLLDTLFAVVRRAGQRRSPAVADLKHLHHRLMRLGHGHRQAVVLLWAWTTLLSGIVLWPGVTNSHNEIPPIAAGALAIGLYTVFAPKGRTSLTSDGDNAKSSGHLARPHRPRRGWRRGKRGAPALLPKAAELSLLVGPERAFRGSPKVLSETRAPRAEARGVAGGTARPAGARPVVQPPAGQRRPAG